MSNQLSSLDLKEAHLWSTIPKSILLVIVFIFPIIIGWYISVEGKSITLDDVKNQEVELKKKFQDKYSQVQSLDELKEHKKIVAEQVHALEGLLPNKTEMDKLLSDINQAGISRNLNFELFEPKTAIIKQYYAQIPVNIKIKGKYHEIAHFMSDLASLSRIVNVETLKMTNAKVGDSIELDGSLNTYRLLEESEKTEQKKKNIKSNQNKV